MWSSIRQWLGKAGFTQSEFFKYVLAPWAYQLMYRVRRLQSPVQLVGTIQDLKSIAKKRSWNYIRCQPLTIQQRLPSRTIAEDTRDIIRTGNQRVRLFRKPQWNRNSSRGEMYFSHLYAVTRYPVLETFACDIPNAILLAPTGVVVTPELESVAQSAYERLTGINSPVISEPILHMRYVPGRSVSLLSYVTNNYTHWIMDSLPRLALLNPSDDKFQVIVPSNPKSFQIESLNLLGIQSHRVVEMTARNIRVEKLVLCHSAQKSGVPSAVHLANIRDRLLAATTDGQRHAANRRIYISRVKALRRVVNEEELAPILSEFGFETVVCEDLSFTEQVRLFSESSAVVGVHGAGIINHIFCSPGAVVIEIYNPRLWEHAACRVASLVGNTHWHIWGENRSGEWNSFVDPQKFRKVLTYALEVKKSLSDCVFDCPY